MPLFEISKGELVPFRRLTGGAELYEKEIEDLLWENPEEFTGEALFPIARQTHLPSGGIPDVVALDKTGRPVIFEVKRNVDRKQLAQCLEYAGWARTASLDDLADRYHRGAGHFWAEWQAFTETDAPVVVNPQPRLFLVARDFHGRTESAFRYLEESGVPVKLVDVTVYVDDSGRRFVDVGGDHEPTGSLAAETSSEKQLGGGKRIRIADLIDQGLLTGGEALVWNRPQVGETHKATITANGAIELSDGRVFSTPSRAAKEAANVPAYDGWHAWRLVESGQLLNELRLQYLDQKEAEDTADS